MRPGLCLISADAVESLARNGVRMVDKAGAPKLASAWPRVLHALRAIVARALAR
jgi:hypothetical protein